MTSSLASRTSKVTARILALALVGEALIQVALRLAGDLPVLLFFFYAAMGAVLLPFVPFAQALETQGDRIGKGQRFAIAIILLGVVCANGHLVSVVNVIGWSDGAPPLTILPAWYMAIFALLMFNEWRRGVRRRP